MNTGEGNIATGWRCLVFVLLLLSICVAQRSAFVSTKGREIITPDGKSILLRGINLGNWVDYRAKYNVPLWMGESGENTDAWISAWCRLQERNNIGWCFWPYKKMGSPRCLVTFDQPHNWDLIVRFAEGPRATYKDIRTTRPSIENVRIALDEFISLSKFSNCRLNIGYAKALGINPGE